MRRWAWALALAGLLVRAAPADAAPLVRIRAGLDGWIKPGTVAPVAVEVRADAGIDGAVEVEVQQPGERGDVPVIYRAPLAAGAGETRTATLYPAIPALRRTIAVRVRDRGRVVARAEAVIPRTRLAQTLVALVGADAPPPRLDGASAAYLDENDLPDRWQGYAAVDLLVVDSLDERRLLPAQREALQRWVAMGGRLVVVARRGLLEPLLPATVTGETVLHAAPALGARAPLRVASLAPGPGARVVLAEGPVPLVVWGRHGVGEVWVWAFDPAAPPLRGLAQPWRAAMPGSLSRPSPQPLAADLAPARPAVPASDQVRLAALILAYLIAVQVVAARLARSGRAWIALAAVVVLAAAAFARAGAGIRDRATGASQVTVVLAAPPTDLGRALVAVRIETPYGGTAEVTASSPDLLVRPISAAETIVEQDRGVRVTAAGDAGQTVEVAGDAAVRLPISGTRTADGIEVRNDAARALRGAMLVDGGTAWPLGDVAAGMHRLAPDAARAAPVDLVDAGPDQGRVLRWLFSQPEAGAILSRGSAYLIGWMDVPDVVLLRPGRRATAAPALVVVPLARP